MKIIWAIVWANFWTIFDTGCSGTNLIAWRYLREVLSIFAKMVDWAGGG